MTKKQSYLTVTEDAETMSYSLVADVANKTKLITVKIMVSRLPNTRDSISGFTAVVSKTTQRGNTFEDRSFALTSWSAPEGEHLCYHVTAKDKGGHRDIRFTIHHSTIAQWQSMLNEQGDMIALPIRTILAFNTAQVLYRATLHWRLPPETEERLMLLRQVAQLHSHEAIPVLTAVSAEVKSNEAKPKLEWPILLKDF